MLFYRGCRAACYFVGVSLGLYNYQFPFAFRDSFSLCCLFCIFCFHVSRPVTFFRRCSLAVAVFYLMLVALRGRVGSVKCHNNV